MNEPSVTPNSPEPTEPTTPSLITEPQTPEEPKPNDPNPNPEDPNTPKEPDPAPAEPLTADDLTFPDGFEVQEEFRDEFLTVVNNAELSPKDRAQGLVDLYTKAAQAASEASSQAWQETQTTWREEVKTDYGDKLQPALGRIEKLIDEHGSAELREVFDLTGAGNNLHMIKFLDKVSGLLTEGGHVSGQPSSTEKTTAQKLFPSMKG